MHHVCAFLWGSGDGVQGDWATLQVAQSKNKQIRIHLFCVEIKTEIKRRVEWVI